MKTYTTEQIRNMVLMGNTKSGKTTLAEAMMMEGKVIDRRGTVEAKNTVCDNTEIEQLYQRSIYPTLFYTEYADHKLNFIDTPGSDDFIGGLISAFRVADSGVMLINAQQGVEVGTEIFSRYAEKYNKPLFLAISQLDHEKANWEACLDSLHEAYGNKVCPIQFPVDTGLNFNAFVDVLSMKMYRFKDDSGTREELDVPADLAGKAETMYAELTELAAEAEEKLMEAFFENGTLTPEQIIQGLIIGFRKCEIMPLVIVSGKKDIGVKRLLELVTQIAPHPGLTKSKTVSGEEVPCDVNGAPSLYIYKTSQEQHLGDIAYFRVMSGKITESIDLVNANNGSKERISGLFIAAGKKREKVTELLAGDMGCTVKLKNAKSNHTLNGNGKSWEFEPIAFPPAKFRTAIKAKSEKDDEKLGEILNKASAEDPTIVVEYSKELRQIIVSGQGEHHINTLKWHINNTYKMEVDLIAPKIPYRETITKMAASSYCHKKQSGGAGQFGEVHLLIEPYIEGAPDNTRFKVDGKDMVLSIRNHDEYTMDWGGKLIYNNCIVGGSIDGRFMPAILKGIMEKMEEGPLTGSYARDIKCYVYDGKMHPVDSNEISFKLAGRNAFKDAFKKASPKIMEPIYMVEVMVPSDCMGDVMSDLQNRRALIEGMSSEKGFQILKARVPLAELNKYSTTLSSLTSGRASFTMTFLEYTQVPSDVQERLLKEYEEEEKDE